MIAVKAVCVVLCVDLFLYISCCFLLKGVAGHTTMYCYCCPYLKMREEEEREEGKRVDGGEERGGDNSKNKGGAARHDIICDGGD